MLCNVSRGGAVVQSLERKTGDRISSVRILVEPLRNVDNSVSPTLPMSFGGDTKTRWSLLYGGYAGEVNIPDIV